MIGWKKIFAFFSAISYILIAVFFFKASNVSRKSDTLNEDYNSSKNCSDYNNPCVRFCSSASDGKSNDELFASFMKSKYSGFSEYDTYELKPGAEVKLNSYSQPTKFNVHRGEPLCISKEIREYDKDYFYDRVRFIFLQLHEML